MDPLTIAIINFIITYMMAKKKGLSSTAAALAATGVAAGSYYLAGGTFGGNVPPVSTEVSSQITGLYGDAKDGLKDGLKWVATNPGSALALGAGVGLATSGGWQKYVPWLLGFGGLYLLTRSSSSSGGSSRESTQTLLIKGA